MAQDMHPAGSQLTRRPARLGFDVDAAANWLTASAEASLDSETGTVLLHTPSATLMIDVEGVKVAEDLAAQFLALAQQMATFADAREARARMAERRSRNLSAVS